MFRRQTYLSAALIVLKVMYDWPDVWSQFVPLVLLSSAPQTP